MNKLQTVLDALEKAKRQVIHANIAPHGCINEAITIVKEMMAQEPVAYSYTKHHIGLGDVEALSFSQKPNCTPLYAAPVAVQAVQSVDSYDLSVLDELCATLTDRSPSRHNARSNLLKSYRTLAAAPDVKEWI